MTRNNIFIVLFCVLFVCLSFAVFSIFIGRNKLLNAEVAAVQIKPDDVLLHHSTETQTISGALRTLFAYDNSISFISLNQLSTKETFNQENDKYDITKMITFPSLTGDTTNYKTQYLSGFSEIKSQDNYFAIKHSSALPITQPIKVADKNGKDNMYFYYTKLRRLVDNVEFYYIQLTLKYIDYGNVTSYRRLKSLLNYIVEKLPGKHIIVGDFNVLGHEKVFEDVLGSNNYHICPFYKMATCNDDQGIASPDGIVVSKSLYKTVEYFVDFYPGYSYQHYLIGAKLYIDNRHKAIGTYNITSESFLRFLKTIKTSALRPNYLGNEGKYDKEEDVGSTKDLVSAAITNEGPITLSNNNIMSKINAKSS